MYRKIYNLFCNMKRSSNRNKVSVTIQNTKNIKKNENSSSSKSKKLRRMRNKNRNILIRTLVDVHDERTFRAQNTNDIANEGIIQNEIHEGNKLIMKNIRMSDQIFSENVEHKHDSYFTENSVTSEIRDNEFHRIILEEIAEFYQEFSDLQTDVRILISKNVIVYVLGTNHANTRCKDEVIKIINKVKPKTVLVELCSLRACSCKKHRNNVFQSTPKFTFRYLRTVITQLGFLPAMIFFTDIFREHLVSESSLLHYGGEFIAAMTVAQTIKNCRIILADRPIEITVKRQASSMGSWRGLKITLQVTLALIFKNKMKKLMLNANRLVFDDPKTYEVLVFERDLFLTYSIQKASREYENDENISRIVAVIGQGHIQGIQTYWGKVSPEFIPLIMSSQTIWD